MKIQNLIDESTRNRSQIWQSYDAALETGRDLERKFSKKFNASSSSSVEDSLTNRGTPTEEVIQVITELKNREAKINNLRSRIDKSKREIYSFQNEIKRLEGQKKRIITILIVSACAIPIVIIGLIFINNQVNDDESSKFERSLYLSNLIDYTHSSDLYSNS